MTTRRQFLTASAFALIGASGSAVFAQHDHGDSTPTPLGCAVVTGTPEATPASTIPYDQAYIDMMIPHHQSIIDLAEVAKDQLEDDRLVEIAQAILDTQPGEIEHLKTLREEWYGDPEPAEMSEEIMSVSMGMEHGCAEQGHMDMMSSEWQLKTFEEAENKDLAFIDQTIPHHQMAVDTSEVALEQAEHQEIKDLAQDVIGAQEAEIKALEEIRADIDG